jgi:hypothetical protein
MRYRELIENTDSDDDLFAKPLADRIRARLAELEDQDMMEPDDMIDTVAEEFNLEVEQVYDLLDDEVYENTDDDLFATPKIAFNDVFNEYDEDQLISFGFSYGDDVQSDIRILNGYLEGYRDFRVVDISGGEHDLVLHLDRSSKLKETDDDELFGESVNKKIAKWLHNYAVRMQQEPDHWSAFSADEGDEYQNDIAEIKEQGQVLQSIAQTFATEGLREGLRVFGYRAHEYDNWWWDRIAPELNDETGISLEDLVDEINIGESENPDHDDDELFGTPEKTWEFQGNEHDMDAKADYIQDQARGLRLKFLGRHEYENWVVAYEFKGREQNLKRLDSILRNSLGDGYGGADSVDVNESSDDELFGSPALTAAKIGKLLGAAGITSGEIVDPESVNMALHRIAALDKYRVKAEIMQQQWLNMDEDTAWDMIDDIANVVYDINGDGWEPEDTIYNESDDELFGKKWHERIDMSSIEIDGVDHRDSPDFSDAHVSYAEFDDGKPLNNEQLEWLTNELGSTGKLHELVWDSLYEDRHAL